jgi:hypothetical protein
LPKQPTRARLLELAKRGAENQLSDLLHEIRMLIELFPHLRDSYDPDELPVKFLIKRGARKARRPLRAARATVDAAQKHRAAKPKRRK